MEVVLAWVRRLLAFVYQLVGPQLPGRLCGRVYKLEEDPRLDPRCLKGLRESNMLEGLDVSGPTSSAAQAKLALDALDRIIGSSAVAPPIPPSVRQERMHITAADGTKVRLWVETPADQGYDARPCIVHVHGGGMAICSAGDFFYAKWRLELCKLGTIVVGVDYRPSAASRVDGGPAPFPAGLDDCVAALDWADAHRTERRFSSVVLMGESGGGNLAIATALKAASLSRGPRCDGVYAACPMISNLYHAGAPSGHLRSLVENRDYFLLTGAMRAMANVYTRASRPGKDRYPFAWPYWAMDDHLATLPPTVILLNELDPLRDEGAEFNLRLRRAGVPGYCFSLQGTTHAAELLLGDVLQDVQRFVLADIVRFGQTRASAEGCTGRSDGG